MGPAWTLDAVQQAMSRYDTNVHAICIRDKINTNLTYTGLKRLTVSSVTELHDTRK